MALALEPRTIRETHNPISGRYDASRIADRLGISTTHVARIIQRNEGAVRKRPDAPAYQDGLGHLVRFLKRLDGALHSAEHTRIWLNTPNEGLRNATPMRYLLDGHLTAVEHLVNAALTGQGA